MEEGRERRTTKEKKETIMTAVGGGEAVGIFSLLPHPEKRGGLKKK